MIMANFLKMVKFKNETTFCGANVRWLRDVVAEGDAHKKKRQSPREEVRLGLNNWAPGPNLAIGIQHDMQISQPHAITLFLVRYSL